MNQTRLKCTMMHLFAGIYECWILHKKNNWIFYKLIIKQMICKTRSQTQIMVVGFRHLTKPLVRKQSLTSKFHIYIEMVSTVAMASFARAVQSCLLTSKILCFSGHCRKTHRNYVTKFQLNEIFRLNYCNLGEKTL